MFSHSRRPLKAEVNSSTLRFDSPVFAAAFFTAALMVGRAVALAQLASLFQKPQPPTDWRLKPDCGYRNPAPAGTGDG